MDCSKSLALLSEYRDNALDEEYRALVREHLEKCPPCMDIFRDIDLIVMSAQVIRGEGDISYPDATAIWRRMRLTNQTIH
jgi:predicted anti-sigma-YlaC factor YlaD